MPDASQDKPDLANGIPESDLADGAMLTARKGGTLASWNSTPQMIYDGSTKGRTTIRSVSATAL